MTATRLFLVRHAEVEARYQKVFGGTIDMEISPRGHEQAVTLAGYLRRKPLDAIYASPMKRVQQTLAPLLHNGAPTPVVMPGLHEIDFGDWTGLTWEEVREKFGVRAFEWLHQLDGGAIPNAETVAGCRGRIEPCLREITAGHAGRNIAIFCHGGVIRVLLSILIEWPLPKLSAFEIDYASVTQVAVQPDKVEVELLNFTPWRDLPQ